MPLTPTPSCYYLVTLDPPFGLTLLNYWSKYKVSTILQCFNLTIRYGLKILSQVNNSNKRSIEPLAGNKIEIQSIKVK